MPSYKINLLADAAGLLYSTVRVSIRRGGAEIGSGTAFFFERFHTPDRPACLVTNRHVIAPAETIGIQFHVGDVPDRTSFAPANEEWLDIPDPGREWQGHPNPAIDLCAIPVSRLKALAGGRLDRLFFTPIRSHLIPNATEEPGFPASLDIKMVGYPVGLWDKSNNLPILRQGTTASHPGIDFDGRPEIVVDIACFPGSSGSPVLAGGPERFLGVLRAGPQLAASGDIHVVDIPIARTPTVVTQVMIHLGYIIKAREVLTLAESI
jgi:hypothetical protein